MNEKEKFIEEMAWELVNIDIEAENGTSCRMNFEQATTVACELIDKDYRKESDVVAEVLGKVREEIKLALDSNYKARQEHIDKHFKGTLYIYDDFISLVDGKIQALRGIDDFIDEEFVKSALLNEAKLREPAHQVADARRLRTKFDKKDERLQIVKDGRLPGKTAQMKLESFDALKRQYLELLKEYEKLVALCSIEAYENEEKENRERGFKRIKLDLPKLPRTNFDRITSSVESLARYMASMDFCPFNRNGVFVTCNKNCIECFKEYLQKECEG